MSHVFSNQDKVVLDIHKILAQMNIDEEKYTRICTMNQNNGSLSSPQSPSKLSATLS